MKNGEKSMAVDLLMLHHFQLFTGTERWEFPSLTAATWPEETDARNNEPCEKAA